MTMPAAYLTAEEAGDLLASIHTSSNPRRTAFEALSEDDQETCLLRATMEIDAVAWRGHVADLAQGNMWPRIHALDTPVLIDPTEEEEASFADIPDNVRLACAAQAAFLAQREEGADATGHVLEAAARGVTAMSAGGMSETIDDRHARTPWAALCREAQGLLERYRAVGGVMT